MEGVEPALLKKQLRAEVQIADEITISGDPLLVHFAVSNLLQNAIDFSPEQRRIGVTAQARMATGLRLCVDDEGPGDS